MDPVHATALRAAWRVRELDYIQPERLVEGLLNVGGVASVGDGVYRFQFNTPGDGIHALFAGAVIEISRGRYAGYYEVVDHTPGDGTADVYSLADLSGFTGEVAALDFVFDSLVEAAQDAILLAERDTGQSWLSSEERNVSATAGTRTQHLNLGCIPREVISVAGESLGNLDLPRAARTGILTKSSGCWSEGTHVVRVRAGYAPLDWPQPFIRGLEKIVASKFISDAADRDDEGVEGHGSDGYSEALGAGGRHSRTAGNLYRQGYELIMKYSSGVVA